MKPFQGRVKSRRVPLYPMTAEREYHRAMMQCMERMERTLKKEMPALERAVEEERARKDAKDEGDGPVHREIERLKQILKRILIASGLEKLLWKVAAIVRNKTVREFIRAVKATFGIDLDPKHYGPKFGEEQIDVWVKETVERAESLPDRAMDRMEKKLTQGAHGHRLARDVVLGSLALFTAAEQSASSLARNEVGNIHSRMSRFTQEDSGVERYVWSTCKDERVRPGHRALEGKTFSWDDPPDVGDGRHCHPGEDYNCRCVAVPVFESEHVHFPERAQRRRYR